MCIYCQYIHDACKAAGVKKDTKKGKRIIEDIRERFNPETLTLD